MAGFSYVPQKHIADSVGGCCGLLLEGEDFVPVFAFARKLENWVGVSGDAA